MRRPSGEDRSGVNQAPAFNSWSSYAELGKFSCVDSNDDPDEDENDDPDGARVSFIGTNIFRTSDFSFLIFMWQAIARFQLCTLLNEVQTILQ